jgi:2,5-diketo-D-gluconate reductase A
MATSSETADSRVRSLADGHQIPLLGLGVWQVPNGPEAVNAVRSALELGYRHIDTAQLYGNEESVGRGLRESGVPRDEVFVTTKFHPSRKDPVAELERSLRGLGLDYVDLYLVHWPQGSATRAWPGLERSHALGYARSIGVSNFDVRELEQVIATATIPPVVDQVRFSPFDYARNLLDGASQRRIVVEAYSPLGTGRYLSNRTVRRIAAGAGRTAAQVLLRWGLQRGVVVLPKSTHRERIEENAQIFDFTLGDQEMETLDALDRSRPLSWRAKVRAVRRFLPSNGPWWSMPALRRTGRSG